MIIDGFGASETGGQGQQVIDRRRQGHHRQLPHERGHAGAEATTSAPPLTPGSAGDRLAGAQGPRAARLLQGRREDRQDLPGDRRRALRGARRPRHASPPTAPSPSSAAARCRSTRAARRSIRRRSRRRSSTIRRCTTPSSSARRTSASASRSPPSCRRAPARRPTAEELIEFAAQHLARYKLPRADRLRRRDGAQPVGQGGLPLGEEARAREARDRAEAR